MTRAPLLIDKDGGTVPMERVLTRAASVLAVLRDDLKGCALMPLCSRHEDFLVAIVVGRYAGAPIILPNDPSANQIDKIVRETGEDVIALTSGEGDLGDVHGLRTSLDISPIGLDAGIAPLTWGKGGSGMSTLRLFTSGTTGDPVAHAHAFADFDAGAAFWAERLQIDQEDVTIVSTVPPQHMYGFEATAALPLAHPKVSVFAQRPFLNADIVDAIEAAGPNAMLVTIPLHLEMMVRDNLSLGPFRGVVSATSPLSSDLARAAEDRFGAPVTEVFGTTETGMIATRRAAAEERFLPRADLGISFAADRMIVKRQDGRPDVGIDDVVVPDGEGFRYVGRGDDLINIAGKRASLDGLSTLLRGIDGVDDGVFVMPQAARVQDPRQARAVQPRLCAFFVGADRSVDYVVDRLKDRMPASFLPRRLIKLDELPRTATGKIRVGALLAMLDGNLSSFVVPSDHPALAGHFPGNPLVPGVVIVDCALHALGIERREEIRSVKFKGVLRPTERCYVEKSAKAHSLEIHCRTEDREIMTAQIKTSG